jgi:hypothetical protein
MAVPLFFIKINQVTEKKKKMRVQSGIQKTQEVTRACAAGFVGAVGITVAFHIGCVFPFLTMSVLSRS